MNGRTNPILLVLVINDDGVEAVDGRIKTDGGGAAVAAIFVGVLVVLLDDDDDDGTTTRGITAVTNDGRFESWAVMGFNVRRGGPSSSGVAAANAAMRGGTAGTREEIFGSTMTGIGAAVVTVESMFKVLLIDFFLVAAFFLIVVVFFLVAAFFLIVVVFFLVAAFFLIVVPGFVLECCCCGCCCC